MKMPEIVGSNLEGREFRIPKTLDGEYNLVIFAFWRSQQTSVDTWIDFLQKMEYDYPKFRFYEIPTISFGYLWMKPIIDGGMRAGIPDLSARERTITLYLYKNNLLRDLNVSTQKKIHLYLVDREGKVYWQEVGDISNKKSNSLEETLITLFNK